MLDAILLWPDGSCMYQADHCDNLDRWRGDDFEVVPSDDPRYAELSENASS